MYEPKPFAERKPDRQYQDRLRSILSEGVYTKNPFQDKGRFTHLTLPPMVFKLDNGFPLITEREIRFWRKPIAELIAFINGARTLTELESYGCGWWDKWAYPKKCAAFGLEAGDLGPGSYGAAFHDFPMPDGSTFNQFEHLVRQIKKYPSLATHVITPWIPYYTLQHDDLQRKVVVAPCHGWIRVVILNGKLTLRMNQRSADVPIGVPANMVQYAALTLMLAQVTGFEPDCYIHSLDDAQIYEDQQTETNRLIEREPRRLPTMRITDSSIIDLFAFRPEHFELSDYHPHPAMSDIPVTE
jgi:thymidylate synthase